MSFEIAPGSSRSTSNSKQGVPTARTQSEWEGSKLTVAGVEIRPGSTIALFRARTAEVVVEVNESVAKELRLEIADSSGLILTVEPETGWQQCVDGKCRWNITPPAGISGKGTLIFISKEVNSVWIFSWMVISTQSRDEFHYTLDGQPHDHNKQLSFYRGNTHEFKCFSQSGSPLKNTGVHLRWTPAPVGLEIELKPEEGQSQPLAETGAKSEFVCGDVKDGECSFTVYSDEVPTLFQQFAAKLVTAP